MKHVHVIMLGTIGFGVVQSASAQSVMGESPAAFEFGTCAASRLNEMGLLGAAGTPIPKEALDHVNAACHLDRTRKRVVRELMKQDRSLTVEDATATATEQMAFALTLSAAALETKTGPGPSAPKAIPVPPPPPPAAAPTTDKSN